MYLDMLKNTVGNSNRMIVSDLGTMISLLPMACFVGLVIWILRVWKVVLTSFIDKTMLMK